jgi:hypothetical protein
LEGEQPGLGDGKRGTPKSGIGVQFLFREPDENATFPASPEETSRTSVEPSEPM